MAVEYEEEKRRVMKRYGNLIPLITEPDNMYRAFEQVVSQLKEPRRTAYRKYREAIIGRLTESIGNGSFKVRGYKEMLVTDGPKERVVQSPSVEDRVGCNAIMKVVEEKIYPSVIRTSAASIPGRGMHHLFAKMRHDIENDREGTRYYYKCDVRKYYESIDQEMMWQCVQRYIKDPLLLPMLRDFVTMMDEGLSIGLRSSQCFGNIFLSGIDHYFKDYLRVRYYYRYCDDIVILAGSKEKLWMLRDIIHERMEEIGLKIKDSEIVRPLSAGLDFLGFVYDGNKALLRKRTKQRAARRLADVKSRRRRLEIIGSFKGMAKWGDCKHLYKSLTGKSMETFSEIMKRKQKEGVTYTGKDGKRILAGDVESLRSLANTRVTILDFEPDITTRNGARYAVQIRREDGRVCKYLTNDSEQKFWLEETRRDGLLPFECTIVPQSFGNGKVKYKFT